ncbi:hypothetical protein LSH36_70g02048 [Paralvinella palmiformis]|uniref:C2H2-type domain-containing protein n=1 Tax=Paralvinella palmiformis TaxID=53620 RepID=A0AAD9K3S4_9ANNE|nr:hypothetical protein LSH36_70g02048 [Paralvinella palmiformis]
MQAGFGFPRFRVVKDKLTGLYKCHLCSYKSVYGSSLRSHFAVHSNARPYGCDMCSYEAKRLPDLKKHKILKHIRKNHTVSSSLANRNPLQVFRDPGSGLYRCQHCSYQSDNPRCVRSHLAVHSHLRPYACDTCSYEAKRSSDLSKHKIIKHGRIPSRRNRSRKVPTIKADTTYNPGGDVIGGQKAPGIMVACSASKLDSHHGPMELEHCDVLSDLDYSLMSPTRAALEALRRCNMMEPLDVFNEYSGHDGNQPGSVFPESETHGHSRRQHQNEQLQPAEVNQIARPNYSILVPFSQGRPVNRNDNTVFIKPEPPDDYFEHIRSQNAASIQKVNPMENEISTTNMSPEQRFNQEASSPQLSNPDAKCERTVSPSDKPAESSQQNEMNSDRVRSERSEGSESQSDEKTLTHLERRNVSGSSLIRPVMPNPRQPPEYDPGSLDCTQCRESEYSYSGVSAAVIQPMCLKSEVEHDGSNVKKTNTRKAWTCQHCDIMFFDGALYFMHMGLHNSEDPWRCNMCCTKFYDVYGFTSHFVNGH